MRSLTFIIPILLLSTFISCTGNDLFDDEVKLSNNTISGTVKLEDQSDHSGIYVWFPLTDKGVFSDKTGKYEYSLPSNFSRKGLEYFQFYFYVNDYVYQKDSVKIRDGKFEYDDQLISDKGVLKKTYSLKRLFTIEKSGNIDLPTFPELKLFIWVEIRFHAQGSIYIPTDSSFIYNKKTYYSISSFSVYDSSSYIINSEPVETTWRKFGNDNLNQPQYFILNLNNFINLGFEKGNFTLLPFLWGNRDQIPVELLNNLLPDINFISGFENERNRIKRLNYYYSPPD